MHKNTRNYQESKVAIAVKAIVVGALITVVALGIFSYVMTLLDSPPWMISLMASISICLGSYVSGYLIAKKRRRSGLATGLLTGILIFFIIFILGLIFSKTPISVGIISKAVMIIVCSIIGGIAGVNTKIKT